MVEAMERGWDQLVNGELIAAAEAEGFEILLTTDKNMRYQQNLTGRKIAFVVLGNQQWPTLRRYVDRVVAAVNAATPGSYAGQLRRSGNSLPVTPTLTDKTKRTSREVRFLPVMRLANND
ncbi:MAG: hypothetical protein WCF68_02010 [Terriglobales bacterium]